MDACFLTINHLIINQFSLGTRLSGTNEHFTALPPKLQHMSGGQCPWFLYPLRFTRVTRGGTGETMVSGSSYYGNMVCDFSSGYVLK